MGYDPLAYSLTEQLLNNIGWDESVTFSKDLKGLHIRRTAKHGELRLDLLVATIETHCARDPSGLLGERLYEMALQIRGQ